MTTLFDSLRGDSDTTQVVFPRTRAPAVGFPHGSPLVQPGSLQSRRSVTRSRPFAVESIGRAPSTELYAASPRYLDRSLLSQSNTRGGGDTGSALRSNRKVARGLFAQSGGVDGVADASFRRPGTSHSLAPPSRDAGRFDRRVLILDEPALPTMEQQVLEREGQGLTAPEPFPNTTRAAAVGKGAATAVRKRNPTRETRNIFKNAK